MEAKFVGTGWENQYGGIRISIKREELLNIPVNAYGDVLLYVGKRKQIDQKSKASHFVKYNPPENNQPIESIKSEIPEVLTRHGYSPDNDMPF